MTEQLSFLPTLDEKRTRCREATMQGKLRKLREEQGVTMARDCKKCKHFRGMHPTYGIVA